MSYAPDVDLSDDNTAFSVSVRHPSGRELLVTVTLNTADPDASPVVNGPELVVYLDTVGWEPTPTPGLLRVNVNDGGVFGYPDEES